MLVEIYSFNELVDACKVSVRKVRNEDGSKSEDLLRYGYLPSDGRYEAICLGWQVVGEKKNVKAFTDALPSVSKNWEEANGFVARVKPTLVEI